MMDGIAIDSSEYHGIGTEFTLAGTQAAGAPALEKLMPNTCFEVMTGAVLPIDCDCVVPVEEISITGDSVILTPDADVTSGKFIHPTAFDTMEDKELISPNARLGATELAIAASVGHTQLKVSKLPRILIITSGDEVIPPEQAPKDYQIRRSHPILLKTMIESSSLGSCKLLHLSDEKDQTQQAIQQSLTGYDFLIFTGGISKGKFDFIAPTLTELVGEATVHGVRQKPGKPFGFWNATSSSPNIFALPGNPFSVFATAVRYLLPALRQHLGLAELSLTLPLAVDFNWTAPISGFAAISINEKGEALPQPTKNSGNYLSLTAATGVIEINQANSTHNKGSHLRFFPIIGIS